MKPVNEEFINTLDVSKMFALLHCNLSSRKENFEKIILYLQFYMGIYNGITVLNDIWFKYCI